MEANFTTASTQPLTAAELYQSPVTALSITVAASILITFLVVGVLANALTIAVVMTYSELHYEFAFPSPTPTDCVSNLLQQAKDVLLKHHTVSGSSLCMDSSRQSVFMRFIVSLCVSDLLSALISWLFLYRRTWGFDSWELPPALCKLYWGADLMTSYVTALHILSFAVLRWISIQFPLFYHKIAIRHGNIWIVLIWVICFGCGFVPFFVMFGAKPRRRNTADPDSAWPACTLLLDKIKPYLAYQRVAYPIFLILPAIGVLIFCVLVALIVKSRTRQMKRLTNQQQKRLTKEKQAVVQLVLIIVSFFIGYIPYIAYDYWAVQDRVQTNYTRRVDYWFGLTEYFFLRFSECLNPFFYNLGSTKMRKHTVVFVKRKLCCLILKIRKQTSSERRRARSSASSDGLKTTGSNLGV